jgi:hypothetical protein
MYTNGDDHTLPHAIPTLQNSLDIYTYMHIHTHTHTHYREKWSARWATALCQTWSLFCRTVLSHQTQRSAQVYALALLRLFRIVRSSRCVLEMADVCVCACCFVCTRVCMLWSFRIIRFRIRIIRFRIRIIRFRIRIIRFRIRIIRFRIIRSSRCVLTGVLLCVYVYFFVCMPWPCWGHSELSEAAGVCVCVLAFATPIHVCYASMWWLHFAQV